MFTCKVHPYFAMFISNNILLAFVKFTHVLNKLNKCINNLANSVTPITSQSEAHMQPVYTTLTTTMLAKRLL